MHAGMQHVCFPFGLISFIICRLTRWLVHGGERSWRRCSTERAICLVSLISCNCHEMRHWPTRAQMLTAPAVQSSPVTVRMLYIHQTRQTNRKSSYSTFLSYFFCTIMTGWQRDENGTQKSEIKVVATEVEEFKLSIKKLIWEATRRKCTWKPMKSEEGEGEKREIDFVLPVLRAHTSFLSYNYFSFCARIRRFNSFQLKFYHEKELKA